MAGVIGLGMLLGVTATAPAQTYKVDPVHSFVVFKIEHMNTGWVWGRFNAPAGTFALEGDNPQIDVTVEVKNIDTGVEPRDNHLRSDDFFKAEAHPTITFKSTQIEKVDDNTYKATGEITLLGKTNPVTVELKVGQAVKGMQQETRRGLQGTFTVKRSDYGMDFMLNAIGDEVELHVALEGIQE